jgi:hypothetical protein
VDSPGGRLVPAGAPLARAVQDVLRKRSGSDALDSVVTAGTDLFFRFEASPEMLDGIARGLFEVMPSVDGGFRSAIRTVVGKKVVDHGRYVPVAARGAGPRTLVARGSALASMGPAVMVAALDIMAEAEQRRRLEAIRKIAATVQDDQLRERLSTLRAAAKRLDLAARSAFDTGYIAPALGIDSAAASVSTAWDRSASKLAEWLQQLADLPETVDPAQLETAFPGIGDPAGGEFWRELAVFRASLALHTRATMLAAIQAAEHDPDHSYSAFKAGLGEHLSELDTGTDQLREFVRALADREIALRGLVSTRRANQATALTRKLMRLAEELAHPRPVNTLPVAIGPGGRLQLEGRAHPDGSVTLLGPDVDVEAVRNGNGIADIDE